jgi:glycosyltransferase involved in cell wall biosynthesis
MRVLVLSSTFPSSRQPTRGVFVRERVRRLAKRCEVVVVAPTPWFPLNRWIRRDRDGVPLIEHQDGLTVYHPRFLSIPRYAKSLDASLYFLSLLAFVRRLGRSFPFDVIDAHFAFPDGVAAALLARTFRCPVVVTLRGSIVRLSGYRLHRPQLRWVLRHADRVTAVSESLAQVAVSLGVPREALQVIPNGVDATIFRPLDRVSARQLVGLPAERPILLTVAGLYEDKGQQTVIDTLPALLERSPKLLYVMVGSPRPGEGYRRRLEASAGRAGLRDHVYFAGARPHEELPAWFSAADATVLATRSEGWPNVLLESLACGTPVVATRVGGTSEIVRDGLDGFLVPYGDGARLRAALRQTLDTEWNRPALSRHAHGFDWEDTVDRALEELNLAVKGSR